MHHMYIYMATDRSTELHNNACVAWYGMGAPSSRSSRPPPRRIKWRSKHYVSVAMVGALVAIAQANVAVYRYPGAGPEFERWVFEISNVGQKFIFDSSKYTHAFRCCT